jgi:curved DNA-binding protein CbpA
MDTAFLGGTDFHGSRSVRYDSCLELLTAARDRMQGQISEHPLAELILEIAGAKLSGALRLAQPPAKVAIYFADGRMVLASSNLRAHRLREVVKRHGLTEAHVAEFSLNASDHELAEQLVERGLLKAETLAAMRANQVGDVLRLALLWTEGEWEFAARVRLADDTRVEIEMTRLLRECARHLPAAFVTARLLSGTGEYSRTQQTETNLTPEEALILERASNPVSLPELNSAGDEEGFRVIYGLTLSGLLERSNWPVALSTQPATIPTKPPKPAPTVAPILEAKKIDEEADVTALFARLESAKDEYSVLDVGRRATIDEIKSAYHDLARRFHPDRFHQSAPELRTQIESAFARIARAYETLSSPSLRASYDYRETMKPGVNRPRSTAPSNGRKTSQTPAGASPSEKSFQRGLEALRLNRMDEAIRFLGEAATTAPREARYRAQYGYALISRPQTRRLAETELQAALTLEPNNAEFRVMLAGLYQRIGLIRRAEGELTRALGADPNNDAARTMLATLKNKS